jgi:hypothetical protein
VTGGEGPRSASPADLSPARMVNPTSLIYVVGEVVISVLALVGGFLMVFYSPEESVKLVGSGVLSAVTALWFTRRQGEQSNNALSAVADGKLTRVLDQLADQKREHDALVTLLVRPRRED